MNSIKEVQETFNSKLNDIKRFIFYKIGANKDLQQEALLSVWTGLLKSPKATGAYLRTRLKWRVRDVAISGSSVDKPHTTRKDIELIRTTDFDIDDNLCLECLTNRYQPMDEQVIDKVDTERFLNSLDYNEHQIVQYKLDGMCDSEVIRELHMSYKRYYGIKRELKPKIAEHFSV